MAVQPHSLQWEVYLSAIRAGIPGQVPQAATINGLLYLVNKYQVYGNTTFPLELLVFLKVSGIYAGIRAAPSAWVCLHIYGKKPFSGPVANEVYHVGPVCL